MRSTRDGAPLHRFAWWLDTSQGLILMFALALAIRLALGPTPGFFGDVRYFRVWTQELHVVSIRHFYGYVGDTTYVYPPGYLYILALLARVTAGPSNVLLKLPSMIGDLSLAWLSGVFAVRMAPAELLERVPVRALVVAAVLFNPAVIALSVVWGQVDAVPAAFVLASLLLVLTGKPRLRREIVAMVFFAVAFAMKPQSSFLFPVIAYALFRRHLYRRRASEVVRGLGEIAVSGAISLGLLAVSGIPFGLSPSGLKDFYSQASNGYKITSVWAFNAWGVVGFQRGDVRSAPAGTAVQFVVGLPAFDVGVLAFFAATAYVIWRAHRSINRGADEARVLLAASAMTSLLAFTLLTRMHERYLFPVLACLAPLVLWRGYRWIYGIVSGLFIMNLWYPFAVYNRYWHVVTFQFGPVFNWVFGNIDTTDTWQKKMWSVFMCAACAVLVARGFRWLERADRVEPPEPPDQHANPPVDSGAVA